LAAQAQVKRAVFETVLNRYQTLLAERAFMAPAAAIVSRAVPSARPSFPKTALFLVIAAMVALLIGAAAAILLQLRHSSSMGITAIADALGIRPLAAIPRFKNKSRADGVTEIKDPRLFIESVRFLRDAVLDRQANRQSTMCLVTSVLPRQGKSLVAMSLARAIARTNRKTLFMEIDLRQPTGSSLARRAPPEDGLAAVLEGRESIHDVMIRDESTGLDMLLAESNAATALDRLTTVAMESLLDQLRSRYAVIVIDSPPIGIVADALTLIPLVDQTIMVAKEGDTPLDELKKGMQLLMDRGAKSVGLVLTSVDPDGLSSVDKRTLHRYVRGVPVSSFSKAKRGRAVG
jgi:capsular exopolysaccharide synthesis family protein